LQLVELAVPANRRLSHAPDYSPSQSGDEVLNAYNAPHSTLPIAAMAGSSSAKSSPRCARFIAQLLTSWEITIIEASVGEAYARIMFSLDGLDLA
jgi:hypothetical protein